MLDKHEQWRALCDEHEVARASYFANSRMLTDKYTRVFQGDVAGGWHRPGEWPDLDFRASRGGQEPPFGSEGEAVGPGHDVLDWENGRERT